MNSRFPSFLAWAEKSPGGILFAVTSGVSPSVAPIIPEAVKEFGGGRRGAFLLLRYVFIIAACYLVIYAVPDGETVPTSTAVMIALALASNVLLSLGTSPALFAWYVEAPVLVADALWVSWALHTTGAMGAEFLLLYVFVLFASVVGRNLLAVLIGCTVVAILHAYFAWDPAAAPIHTLLRICFFFSVALFYGTVLTEIRRERRRADKGYSWARELRSEVAKRTMELEQLYHEARAANHVKDEFVAAMSHELRTPIHIILGYTDILTERDSTESSSEIGQRIRAAAVQLQRLVDGVLALGRTPDGQVPLDVAPVFLPAFVEDVRRRERPMPARGVSVQWQIDRQLPTIETDSAKLAVILENLIDNALKFTMAGHVTVTAQDDPTEERVVFRVDDTGPGIDSLELSQLFEPFHETRPAPDGHPAGVGLGLAIVKRYVTLLDGDIVIESTPGTGTTICVTIPYARAREYVSQPHAA